MSRTFKDRRKRKKPKDPEAKDRTFVPEYVYKWRNKRDMLDEHLKSPRGGIAFHREKVAKSYWVVSCRPFVGGFFIEVEGPDIRLSIYKTEQAHDFLGLLVKVIGPPSVRYEP